jgi:transcriptional accessory protein Tex/SPT6
MDVILPSALYALQVGSLVTGTVRRIEPFGVFVGINNTRISGLLHISNVSRRHIDTVDVSEMLVATTLLFFLFLAANTSFYAGNV